MKTSVKLRSVGAALAAMAALAVPPLAHATHHGMRPFLRVGPAQASADVTVDNGAGTRYGLRTCQVGLSVGSCYDPYQMRTAYGVDKLIAAGYDGRGKTVVILDAFQDPNIQAQLDYVDAYYGLPHANFSQIAPDGLTPFDPNDGNMVGWAEEISLDVLWSHAIAPGANILLVLAKDNSDEALVSALKYVVDNDLGDVVSMSFGENETCLGPELQAMWHDTFAAATRKGITLVASSGDQGAAQGTCDGTSWTRVASSPASDPLVTAVGGTELHAADFCLTQLGCDPSTHPAPGTYEGEIAWNEGLPYGDFGNVFGYGTIATGGGYSVTFPAPPYQQATLPGGKGRAVPDVSYNGAVLHGVLTYLDIPGLPVGFYRFGGTSAGAPQWSAITAIADQKANGRLGFLNAALYQIGQVNHSYPAALHDVTSGTNSALEFDENNNPVDITGYSAGSGWDATTGYGSPQGPSLVDYLISYTSPGDGVAAIATSKPKPNAQPVKPGHMRPN